MLYICTPNQLKLYYVGKCKILSKEVLRGGEFTKQMKLVQQSLLLLTMIIVSGVDT
jgi:hypothetical protein